MKTIVLCGGRGMRLAAHYPEIPKPLVEIGGRPILWHVLRHYAHHGFRDFILALGYRGEQIKRWFLETPRWQTADCTLTPDHRVETVEDPLPPIRIDFRDTGVESATGERLLRLRDGLAETFFVTYGDGLADIDLKELLAFHRRHGRIATVTAIKPRVTFGVLELEENRVVRFREKPPLDSWVNGGFFVFEPALFDYLEPGEMLETSPMERLVAADQLRAFRHEGFWQCMDTYKDTLHLNELWNAGRAPWVPGGPAA